MNDIMIGGSNILNGQKTLFTKALDKYGYNTQETMVALVSKGKGQMPAYASFISPKGNVMPAKYTEEQIIDISDYTLDQASKNWGVQIKGK
jgi:cytochrome c6